MSIYDQLRVFCALIMRDQRELRLEIKDSLINASIMVIFQGLMFLFLYPAMGMSTDLAAPIFIGTIVHVFFFIGFSKSMAIVYDLQFTRCIDYQLTLPIPRIFVVGRYIIDMVITMFCNAAPLLVLAKLMLGSSIVLKDINWLGFIVLFILGMFIVSVLFLIVATASSFQWFTDSLWQQFLLPIEILGGIFFTWGSIQKPFPMLSSAMLFNPITYLVEGLRSVVFVHQALFSLYSCSAVLLVSIAIGTILLHVIMKKRLDTV